MKKLFTIVSLLLLVFYAVYAAPASAPAPAITTTQLLLNLGDIETRIDCGFSADIPDAGAVSLNSETTSAQTIEINAAQNGDHITINDASFYIWYYISTVVSNVSMNINMTALSNQQPTPDYINYKFSISDVVNTGEDDNKKEGDTINITAANVVTNNNTPTSLTIIPSTRVAGLNRGFIKCDIGEYNINLATLTNDAYYTTLKLTLTSV